MNIDSLSIKVTAEDKASQSLNSLAGAMTKLKTAVQSCTSGIAAFEKLPQTLANIQPGNVAKLAEVSKQLATALKPLATECEKVAAGFKAMSTSANGASTALPKVSQGAKQAAASSGTLGEKWNKLKQNASGIIAKIWAIRWAFNMVKNTIGKTIEESTKYEETLNMFTATMGKYAQQYFQYAQSLEKIGIDSADWMQNQASFFTLIEGFGVASDKAADMSENLTRLGYDMASFWNLDFDAAMAKLESGITGQTKAVRSLGIDISNAAIEEARLKLGIDKTTQSMSQAEKTELRYYLMMTRVTQAHGDLTRTLYTPANQLRLLQMQFQMVSRSIGNIFIPILNKVLPYVNAVAKAVRILADGIANIFGYKLTEVDYSGLDVKVGDVNTGGIDDVADSTNNADKALKNATKDLKKLKRQLAGFDEINNLTSTPDTGSGSNGNSGGGGGTSGGSTGGGLNLPDVGYDWDLDSFGDTAYNKMKKMFEKWAGLLATAMIGIGLLLIVTGHPMLGVAFILSGIAIAALAIKNPDIGKKVKKYLTTMLVIGGMVAIALGCIMMMTGAGMGVGIALIVSGASMIVSAMALSGEITGQLQGLLSTLLKIITPFFLALGVVLLFNPATLGVGIGLLFLGVVSMVAAYKLDDGIKGKVRTFLNAIMLIASAALLALGILMIMTPGGIPLGIGAIIAGAAALVGAVGMSINIKGKVKKMLATIMNIAGAALLAIGAILCLTGVGTPIGLALMLAGAMSLASAEAIEPGGLARRVKGMLNKIGKVIKGVAQVGLGVALLLVPGMQGFAFGLIKKGIKTLTGKENTTGFDSFVGNIQTGLGGLGQKFKGTFRDIKDRTIGAFKKIKKGAGSAWSKFKKKILGINDDTTNDTDSKWASLKKKLFGTTDDMIGSEDKQTGLLGKFKGFGSKVTELISGAVDGSNFDGSSLKKKIQDALGLEDGVSITASIKTKFSDTVESIKSGWKARTGEISDKTAEFKAKFGQKVAEIKEAWQERKDKITDKAGEFKAKFAQTVNNIKEAWKDRMAEIKSKTAEFAAKFKQKVSEIKEAWKERKAKWKDAKSEFKIEFTKMVSNAYNKGRNAIIKFKKEHPIIGKAIITPPALAQGGFPGAGLFIAREYGNPEMVGTIGRRPAVANNDQIIAGITRGVSMANARQELLLQQLIKAVSSGGGDIILRVGSDELGRASIKGINKVQAQSGQLLLDI